MGFGFTRFAQAVAALAGRPAAFVGSIVIIIAWAVTGPLFGWSDTWQLIINTGTTIITFLMVFLIQHTTTRDASAVQLKLDELIRVTDSARNELIALEREPDERIGEIRRRTDAAKPDGQA